MLPAAAPMLRLRCFSRHFRCHATFDASIISSPLFRCRFSTDVDYFFAIDAAAADAAFFFATLPAAATLISTLAICCFFIIFADSCYFSTLISRRADFRFGAALYVAASRHVTPATALADFR